MHDETPNKRTLAMDEKQEERASQSSMLEAMRQLAETHDKRERQLDRQFNRLMRGARYPRVNIASMYNGKVCSGDKPDAVIEISIYRPKNGSNGYIKILTEDPTNRKSHYCLGSVYTCDHDTRGRRLKHDLVEDQVLKLSIKQLIKDTLTMLKLDGAFRRRPQQSRQSEGEAKQA
jgi:hypothetical protein